MAILLPSVYLSSCNWIRFGNRTEKQKKMEGQQTKIKQKYHMRIKAHVNPGFSLIVRVNPPLLPDPNNKAPNASALKGRRMIKYGRRYTG